MKPYLAIVPLLCLELFVAGRRCLADPPPSNEKIVVRRDLRYREGASPHLTLDLAYPKLKADRPRPAVVAIHGGGWIEGDKSSFVVRETPGNILEFAEAGFVAATINFRLTKEAPFPACFHDCQCAVRWLRAHAAEYGIDKTRIGAYGNSAGGHLALLLAMAEPGAIPERGAPLADQSSAVQAAVSDSGPIDLIGQLRHDQLRTVIEKLCGGPPDAGHAETYRLASPSSWTSRPTPPLLLIYGEADEQVDVNLADQFVATLSRGGHTDLTYLRLAKVGHCPHSLKRVRFLRPLVIDFFKRALASP